MLILSEKRLISHKNITPAFHISDEKMLLLTEKIGKVCKVRNRFCLLESTKFPPFSQTWSAAKTRFPALKAMRSM